MTAANAVRIHVVGPDDRGLVLAAAPLFDDAPATAWVDRFLSEHTHHLLLALDGEERPVGFVSGVETTHPDKGTEMFVYELAVDETVRRQGIARRLMTALGELARERGCFGMWVATEPDNEAAIATYRSAGAAPPEPTVVLTWTFAADDASDH